MGRSAMWGTYKDLEEHLTYRCHLNGKEKGKYHSIMINANNRQKKLLSTRTTSQRRIFTKWKHSLLRRRKMRTCTIRNLKLQKYNWGEIITHVNSKHPNEEYMENRRNSCKDYKIKISQLMMNSPSRELEKD